MALPYHPEPGTIVVCDYDAGGFRSPEMTKRGLAVIVSPKLKRRNNLATVIPLSSTVPQSIEKWHVELLIDIPPPWGRIPRWAKCDMVATVGYQRLNLPHHEHPVTGSRQYSQIVLPAAEVAALRLAIAAALGFD